MKSVNTPDYVCREFDLFRVETTNFGMLPNSPWYRTDFRHNIGPKLEACAFRTESGPSPFRFDSRFRISRFWFFVNVESCASITIYFVLFSTKVQLALIEPASAHSPCSARKLDSISALMVRDFRS